MYKHLWPNMSVASYVELCTSQTWSHKNSGSSPDYSTLKVEGFEDVEMSEFNATQQLRETGETEWGGLGGSGCFQEWQRRWSDFIQKKGTTSFYVILNRRLFVYPGFILHLWGHILINVNRFVDISDGTRLRSTASPIQILAFLKVCKQQVYCPNTWRKQNILSVSL